MGTPSVDLTVGKILPVHPSFQSDVIARRFWRLSYKVGRDYATGLDACGREIVVPHEREKADSYQRRIRTLKPRNHCGPIIRRYNDFVFRRDAQRPSPGDDAFYDEIAEDADGNGTALDLLMKQSTMRAQVERESYLMPDTTKTSSEEMTQAQAQAAGVRALVRSISADSVVFWRDIDGILVEAIVLLNDEDGDPFALWMDSTHWQKVYLKYQKDQSGCMMVSTAAIESLDAKSKHNYPRIPLVRNRPLFDSLSGVGGESQISPLAESQQAVANFQSLLNEEIYNVTFSQCIVSGVSDTDVKDVAIGNNRIITVPNPAGKMEFIGADPAQAESIRKAIMDEQTELYRMAGVTTGDPLDKSGNPESGIAKAFEFNDLAANLSALAFAAETAENDIVELLYAAAGKGEAPEAQYPDDFDMPDYEGEMVSLIGTLTAPGMPALLRKKAVDRFAKRNLSLTEEEQNELDSQVDASADLAMSAGSAYPFPSRPGQGASKPDGSGKGDK